MDKRFPPSDLKLARLRADGEFPLSRTALHAGAFLGLCLGVFGVHRLTNGFSLLWFQNAVAAAEARAEFSSTLRVVSQLLFVVTAPAVVGVLLAGLVQTRFFFRPSLAAPQFSRLLPLGRSPRVWLRIGGALLGVCWVIFAASQISSLIRGSQAPVVSDDLFTSFLIAPPLTLFAALFLLFSAILAIVLNRVLFIRRHAMTREELEAEWHELEGSSETARRAIAAERGE